MSKLTSLALAAALTPALALGISTVTFASQERDASEGTSQDRETSQGMSGQQEGTGQDRETSQGMSRQQEGTGQDRETSRGVGQDRDTSQGLSQRQGAAGQQQLTSKPSGAFYADDIIGQNVKSRGTDEDIGEVTDLIIGQDGQVVGVIVSVGGFLGLGQKDVALPWDRLQHTMDDDESTFSVDMDQDQLENAPEYERDE